MGDRMSLSKIYRIDDRLYQGAMRFVSEQWQCVLEDIEPDVVLLMAEEVELIPHDDFPLIIGFPVPDDPNGLNSGTFKELSKLCRIIGDSTVLTVCHMGENRSGLASALILVHYGYSPTEAIDLIRKQVQPNSDAPHVLWNPGFVKQLLEFERANH